MKLCAGLASKFSGHAGASPLFVSQAATPAVHKSGQRRGPVAFLTSRRKNFSKKFCDISRFSFSINRADYGSPRIFPVTTRSGSVPCHGCSVHDSARALHTFKQIFSGEPKMISKSSGIRACMRTLVFASLCTITFHHDEISSLSHWCLPVQAGSGFSQ